VGTGPTAALRACDFRGGKASANKTFTVTGENLLNPPYVNQIAADAKYHV
jgi:hypothetical protein